MENGYGSYKAFYVNNPKVNDAIKAENELTTANYNDAICRFPLKIV